jgi:hypothetical protein
MIDEPLAGTARHATAWLLIEQSGPWGKQALIDSHLPPELGQAVLDQTMGSGTEPLLIRRPGRHADAPSGSTRTVLVASVAPGQRWMRRWILADDAALADWLGAFDASAVGRGEEPADGEPWTVPTLALCTNSRRDLCCALAGRALLDALTTATSTLPDGWLWECSHLGGHRFAPTALVLPTGLVLGRADADGCHAALAGGVPVDQARGFSWLPPKGQVADLAVRSALGTDDGDPLTVTGDDANWTVTSEQRGRWQVTIDETPLAPRPASCGKPDETANALIARSVIPAS